MIVYLQQLKVEERHMPRVKLFNEQEALSKAMLLFWQKGYNATSLSDLTQTLNIGKGSFYDTFKGKRQLFEMAFSAYRIANIEMLETMLASETDVKIGIQKLLEELVNRGLADEERKGCFAVNTSAELANRDPEIKAILSEHNKMMHDVIYGYLKNHSFNNGITASQATGLLITFMTGLNSELKVKDKASEILPSVNALMVLF